MDARFDTPANLTRRASYASALQATYGNAYVQRLMSPASPAADSDAGLQPEVADRIEAERSRGRPLDPGVREEMEPALGQSFEGVRVHTDATASSLAESLSAKAFTTGNDIFFKAGAYDPASSEGKQTLAHELTHVVQQGGNGASPARRVSDPHDAAETEASQVGESLGLASHPSPSGSGIIQRAFPEPGSPAQDSEPGSTTTASATPPSASGQPGAAAPSVDHEKLLAAYDKLVAEYRDGMESGLNDFDAQIEGTLDWKAMTVSVLSRTSGFIGPLAGGMAGIIASAISVIGQSVGAALAAEGPSFDKTGFRGEAIDKIEAIYTALKAGPTRATTVANSYAASLHAGYDQIQAERELAENIVDPEFIESSSPTINLRKIRAIVSEDFLVGAVEMHGTDWTGVQQGWLTLGYQGKGDLSVPPSMWKYVFTGASFDAPAIKDMDAKMNEIYEKIGRKMSLTSFPVRKKLVVSLGSRGIASIELDAQNAFQAGNLQAFSTLEAESPDMDTDYEGILVAILGKTGGEMPDVDRLGDFQPTTESEWPVQKGPVPGTPEYDEWKANRGKGPEFDESPYSAGESGSTPSGEPPRGFPGDSQPSERDTWVMPYESKSIPAYRGDEVPGRVAEPGELYGSEESDSTPSMGITGVDQFGPIYEDDPNRTG